MEKRYKYKISAIVSMLLVLGICVNITNIIKYMDGNKIIAAESAEVIDTENQEKFEVEQLRKNDSDDFCAVSSPNGLLSAEVDNVSSNTVVIHNLQTNETIDIEFNDELSLVNAIENVKWIDDEKLAVIQHINPSLSHLSIYDIQSEKVIEEKYGSDFTWDDGKYEDMIYVKHSPHFAGQDEEEICDYEDNTLYKANLGKTISSIAKSSNSKEVFWFTEDNDKELAYLFRGSLKLGDTIKSIQPRKWNSKLGNLTFDNGLLKSSNSDSTYIINPDNLSIVSEEISE